MQRLWVVATMLLCTAPYFHGEDILCYETGNCYKILRKLQQFTKANVSCGPTGSLASMRNEQEAMEILQLLRQLPDKSSPKVFWIGLFRKPRACRQGDKELRGFTWVSGGGNTTMTYWAEKPSVNCVQKNCVGLQSESGPLSSGLGNRTWTWKEYKCIRYFASICRSNAPMSLSTLQVDARTIPHPFANQNTPQLFKEKSKVVIQCKASGQSLTLKCCMVNGVYSCINGQCSCARMKDKSYGSKPRRCRDNERVSCLQQCLNPGNVTCDCTAGYNICDKDDFPPLNTAHSTGITITEEEYEELDEDYISSSITSLILETTIIALFWLMCTGIKCCFNKIKLKCGNNSRI